MGKGSGGCSRPALVIGDAHGASLVGGVHPSVPPALRGYLEETSKTKLTKALSETTSFPEYQTIIFRLAQLRDEHAVAGLMSSADYQKAKAAHAEAEVRLEAARAALAAAESGGEWQPTDEQLQTLERQILGGTWQAVVAEAALQGHPDWMALEAELAKPKRAPKGSGVDKKEIATLDKQIRLALVRKGPLSPEVKQLKAERDALVNGAAPAQADPEIEADARRLQLRTQLIGQRIEDADGVRYSGGEIDLADALTEYRFEREAEVEIAIEEERIKHRVRSYAAERALVARSEQEIEEGHQAVLVHEAAIKRAKLRAERARERQLIFDQQVIDDDFVKGLKSRPHQLRAVFVEGSVLRDHMAHLAYDKGNGEYELVAEIDASRSDAAIRKLVGGKKTTYDLDLPASYSSWANDLLGSIDAQENVVNGVRIKFTPRNLVSGVSPPHSERGMLRMRGSDPEALLATLHERGLATSTCEAVPYESIYRGEHRYGRVAPLYEPLASGKAALSLPEGHMVLHGLTGANGDGGAVNHFNKIVKSGGLKSIAERRRQGIAGMTMSPLGDIASGIDMGVPCKIGDKTNYGGSVFFGMHPEVLSRRDLWFSDRDFGGGHDRHPEYVKYAKSLGQTGLHEPCPVKGRQKHLSKPGGLTRADNEVYIEGDISWNDVDTLFVSSEIGTQMRQTVSKFQAEGLLPKHIRVAVHGVAPPSERKAKKGAKKPTIAMSASGWTVTEDGQVVLAEAVATEAAKEREWTIDDHVQHRSREIARTME